MIVGKDISPKREIYYLGGITLEVLLSLEKDSIEFWNLFQKVNEIERISMNLFTLTLDWLFLLGIITNNKGIIKKCI